MIYAVVPFRGREKIGEAIEDAKLSVYPYDSEDSHVFFVSYAGTTQELAEKVGLKGEDKIRGVSGVVLSVSNYNGFANPNLWEWLRNYDDNY